MKKIMCWMLILCFFITLTACNKSNMVSENNNTSIQDNLYFMKFQSFLAFSSSEEVKLQLMAIDYHPLSKKDFSFNNIRSYNLVYNNQNINLLLDSTVKGQSTSNYTFYSLNFKVPEDIKNELNGITIEKLQTIDDTNKSILYDIGKWEIKILTNDNQSDLKAGEVTSTTAFFDKYKIELNNVSKSLIKIKSIDMGFSNYDVKISSGESYDTADQSKDMNIEMGKKRAFMFKLQEKNNVQPDFVCIKPYLAYEKDGKEEFFITSINPTFYFPPTMDESNIINIIKAKT